MAEPVTLESVKMTPQPIAGPKGEVASMTSVLNADDVEDLIVGTTVLGTGGGGNPQTGRETLQADLALGRKLAIIRLDEIPDDALVVSPYFVGSVAPGSERKPRVDDPIPDPFNVALASIERHFSRKVAATVATELGGGNTAVALHVASQLGVPMLDGDLLGRAGPELHQSTTHIFGESMAPSAVVSATGNVVFIERYANINDYEALARHVSVMAGGHAAVIDTPLTKSIASRIIIRDTISKSLAIGKAVRAANAQGHDPVEAVRKSTDGWLVFKGVVEKYDWRNEKGFLCGDATLTGKEEWRGRRFRSSIKNEHIFAWRDDRPIVMPPDLIIFLDSHGQGITNDALKTGLEVSVVAAKAPEIWRTAKGLEFFGPKHFSFDNSYVPVEKLVT